MPNVQETVHRPYTPSLNPELVIGIPLLQSILCPRHASIRAVDTYPTFSIESLVMRVTWIPTFRSWHGNKHH